MVRGGVFALFLAVCATPAVADISAFFASVVFDETANLLYNGPWLAERLYDVSKLAKDNEDAILPVIREILIKGKTFTALEKHPKEKNWIWLCFTLPPSTQQIKLYT